MNSSLIKYVLLPVSLAVLLYVGYGYMASRSQCENTCIDRGYSDFIYVPSRTNKSTKIRKEAECFCTKVGSSGERTDKLKVY